MVAVDLLTLLLVVGVVVLVISTTVMILTMSPTSRQRRRRPAHPLSPSAEHALALARARATAQTAELTAELTAVSTGSTAASLRAPHGQIIDLSDDQVTGRGVSREITVEHAQAIAEHVAATDPQFVAEVISQWIRADSSEPDVLR